MKKYFVYQLKKNLLPLACLTLFCIVMYVLPISATSYQGWNNHLESGHTYYKPSLYYSTITVALGIMSVFIPIVMFAYKMNKRSVDMHYSLPISKTKILAVNFLTGLILMYASYSIAYFLGFILIIIKEVQRLHLIYYLYLYLASLIPAFITYAITSFIFTRANTIIDGIISVASTLCILAMTVATFNLLSDGYISGVEGMYFFPFTPLSQTATIFGKALIDGYCDKWLTYEVGSSLYNADMCRLISSILWLLLAIAATVGLFISEKNCKAENCGQITESPFCYKVQIPAYAVMFVAVFAESGIVALCAIAFAVFVWSIIYKRSIKIDRKFGIALITSMLGGVLLWSIKIGWIVGIIVLSLMIVGLIFMGCYLANKNKKQIS